jgi:hypothetical protein
VPEAQAEASKHDTEDETELFDCIMNDPEPLQLPSKEPCSRPVTPPKPSASPKVRFERGGSQDHPDAVDGVLRKISDLPVSMTVAEIFSISPAVADGMKKWVARWRVEVGPEEFKGIARTRSISY